MNIDVSNNPLIVEMGLVIAISLVLSQAIGPVISRMIEAIKPTGLVPPNWSGVFAIVISAILGTVFGLLGMFGATETEDSWRFIVYGFIAGILGPGAGAIQSSQVRQGIATGKALRELENATDHTSAVVDVGTNDVYREEEVYPPAEDTWWKDRLVRETEEYEANLGKDQPEADGLFYENSDAGRIRVQ